LIFNQLCVVPKERHPQPFQGAYEKFIEITSHLSAQAPGEQTHRDIEAYLATEGRELLRLLLQEHVDQQGPGRVGEAVHGSDGVVRSHKRDHMETGYQSVFGTVRVARTGYSQRGVSSLFPRDAQLHVPRQSYSHRLQKRVAAKAAKMSFESVASDMVTEAGVRMGGRQIQEIVDAAAQDFDVFSAQPCPEEIAHHAAAKPIQVLTFDGKGVVMRKECLLPCGERTGAVAVDHLVKPRVFMSKLSLSPGIDTRSVGGPQAHDQTHLDAPRRTPGEERFWGDELSWLKRGGADLQDHTAQGVGRDGAAGMSKAAVTDFPEAFREHVLAEPAEQRHSVERGRSWASTSR
jgi:hypothetical protein